MASKASKRKTRRRTTRKRAAPTPRGGGPVGSSFGDFLESEGLRADVTALALKRVIAWQLAEEMKNQALTKQAMATRMETSRSALDRLLDPGSTSLSIKTLDKAAQALGKRWFFELVDA